MYIRLSDNEVQDKCKNPYWVAYRQQRKNAKRREIPFLLDFGTWKQLWDDAGKWEYRGCKSGNYVMCRIGDKGSYESGNVFIDSVSENARAIHLGKPMLEATKKKISEAKKNKPWPTERILRGEAKRGPMASEHKQKISESNKGRILAPQRQRAVSTPDGFYKSGAEAARAFGISTRVAHNRCQSETERFSQWRYV